MFVINTTTVPLLKYRTVAFCALNFSLLPENSNIKTAPVRFLFYDGVFIFFFLFFYFLDRARAPNECTRLTSVLYSTAVPPKYRILTYRGLACSDTSLEAHSTSHLFGVSLTSEPYGSLRWVTAPDRWDWTIAFNGLENLRDENFSFYLHVVYKLPRGRISRRSHDWKEFFPRTDATG